jgi:hypothetical protein
MPNAVRLFDCTLCDKGYPRQLDYEGHLRSYDHNHRQRLADMKKLTAANDTETKPKAGLELRSINIDEAGKKPGMAFTKIAGPASAAAGGSRFKKVGVAVKKADPETAPKIEPVPVQSMEKAPSGEAVDEQDESCTPEDAMVPPGAEAEAVPWEEYDFTKPTGCDHANCPGCLTEGIWSGEWIAI